MQIKRAIYKYGKENFTIKVIEECNVEELDEKETYYIGLYNSYYDGYNGTKGGKSWAKPLKLTEEHQKACIELYKFGFSLREIAKEFNVDKKTVKHILEINNISIRTSRTYKLSSEDRKKIIEESSYMNRKDLMSRWSISKSYLSQLLSGKRRI